jgi:hypothetical protein
MKKLGKYNNEQRCRRWCIVIMQTKAASETNKEHCGMWMVRKKWCDCRHKIASRGISHLCQFESLPNNKEVSFTSVHALCRFCFP